MTFPKNALFVILPAAVLMLTSTAHANSYQYGAAPSIRSIANGTGQLTELSPRAPNTGFVGDRFLGSSETATFFFTKAVKRFDAGKLDKAQDAFRASLRANGSKSMDKLTLHYLAYINQQQGNKAKAKQYAQSYINLEKQ